MIKCANIKFGSHKHLVEAVVVHMAKTLMLPLGWRVIPYWCGCNNDKI